MAVEVQKSAGWGRYCETEGFIEAGFPFNEGFPSNHGGGTTCPVIYDLILRSGERVQAFVDTSTQYRAEGLSWRKTDGTPAASVSAVAAWKTCEPVTHVRLSYGGRVLA